MKVEELRIGNLVFHLHKNEYYKISEGYDIDCGYNYEPIEMTEEILLKCGFVKEDLKPSNKHSNYFSIWINDYKYSFSFAYFREDWGFYHSYTDALREEDNNKFDAISFGIKYLHQLQNLYFALNGKELEINL